MAALSAPPAAAALTVLLSVGASAPGLLWGVPAGRSAAALRPAALHDGEVHRLITYIFVYEDLISLACGAAIIWYFAGSFERNVGTAKHCILTAAFSVLSALLYLLLEPLVSRLLPVGDAKGFLPVAFATLGVSSTRSRMRSTVLFGCRVPVVLVPWLGLCIAWFVPHSSLLGNLCGLLVGEAYGLGYCFCLDFPDSVGSKLDRVFPFTLLKRIPGLKYIPGSSAERRASENSSFWEEREPGSMLSLCQHQSHPAVHSTSVSEPASSGEVTRTVVTQRIIPVPGTYPTQSYHCPSPLALPAHAGAQSQGFHHSHPPGHGLTLGHQAAQQGRAAGHSLSSSHCQARGAFGERSGQCCQLGKFPVPQAPAATGLLPDVQQAPGYPAAPVAPVSAEFTRVQVY